MIALVCTLALALCQTPGRAYEDGRYERARSLYMAALDDSALDPAPILFNLGNCAYRLGRFAEASLWYRRALLRSPGDSEARANLRLAARRLGIANEEPSPFDRVPRLPWLAVAAALETLGLFGVLLARQRWTRAAGVTALGAGLALGVGLASVACVASRREAVVVTRAAALRVEPHRAETIVRRLRRGAVVRVEEASDRWVRITSARANGWTERENLGFVE